MEITLKAKIEVEVRQTIEVDSIDEVCDAVEFFGNHLGMAGTREVGDNLIEYEQTDVIDDVVVDDGEDFCDIDDFIWHVGNNPDHPLYHAEVEHAIVDDLENDEHTAEDEHADGVVDSVDATDAAPSNIIHIPQPPKNTRRAGFDAFKHAFKKIARRF